MASQISRDRLRLALGEATTGVVDVLTSAQCAAFAANDLQVEVSLLVAGALADISNVSMLQMDVKPLNTRDGQPVMSRTLASGALQVALNQADWDSGDPTKAHATFIFTGSDTNLALDDVTQDFWFTIYAYTTDTPARKVTWGVGILTLIDDGSGVTPPAFVQSPTYITLAQAVAMFTVDGTKVNKSGDVMSGPLTFSGSTNPGIELNSLTTTQKNALSGPTAGMFVWDSTLVLPSWYSGAVWNTPVQSVNGLTGTVALNSSLVPENTNLYFTGPRVLASVLTGLSVVAGVVTASDTVLSAIGKLAAGGSPGSGLTSVALSMPTGFLVANTPLVANGTLVVTLAAQAPNTAWMGPTSGAPAAATWRALTPADIPALPESAVSNLEADLTARLQLAGGVMTGQITLPAGTQTGLQALSRTSADGLYAALAGASMVGVLNTLDLNVNAANSPTWAGTPTTANQLVNKTYADLKLALTGGTLSGDLQFSGTGHAGLIVNNLTDAQRAAIGSPSNGMVIYNSTLAQIQVYNGNWVSLTTSSGSAALLNGVGVPSNSLGNNGDYYWNSTTGDLYLKTAGTWSVLVAHGVRSSGDTMTGLLQFSGTGHAGLRLNNFANQTAINALTPAAGDLVYNAGLQVVEVYNVGGGWQSLGVSGTSYPQAVTTLLIHSSSGYGPGTLWAVAADGLYRVTAYMSVNSGAGAGTQALTIGYTDANRSNTQASPGLNTASATNTVVWTAMFWAVNSTNITVTLTNSGTTDCLCNLVVERLV